MFTIDAALEVLRERWGYSSFRPSQREAMRCIGEGDDVLAVLPTGTGKSLLFQLPALMEEGGTIVVSPLIALMKDQVDAAQARGIPAACINSNMDEDDQWDALEGFVSGAYKLLYISPERIGVRSFLTAVQRADVSIVAVDEAHCCSQWGHQFRPEYMHIHRLIRSLSDGETRPQVLAMTATATRIVVEDIVQSLGLKADEVSTLVADPIRPNLSYLVEDGGIDGYGNAWNIFRRIVRTFDVRDGRHIVYVNSRAGAEKLAEVCEEELWSGIAAPYHAGLTGEKRTAIQEDFTDPSGAVKIACATTAFGMGVDVPNIRTVVLFGYPGSLEDYVQQTGRAGRDGLLSKTILIADEMSASFQMRMIENENPPLQSYVLLWDWLHAQLQPGETLRASRMSISQAVSRQGVAAMNPDQVGVVLNRLHSVGLIERRPIEEGVPVKVKLDGLTEALANPGKARPQITHVWRAFAENCVKPAQAKAPAEDPLTVWINKTALKEASGLSPYYVTKALEALLKRGAVLDIGKAQSGYLIKILKWRVPLEVELPVGRIEEKRARDFARFDRMRTFSRLLGEDERKDMLRHYFLHATE
jgi:ATP-dependent DNA helicase RecQ